MFKTLTVAILVLILASLASGVFFLFSDTGSERRMVISLTIRVILSVAFVLLLVIGYFTGQIQPHAF